MADTIKFILRFAAFVLVQGLLLSTMPPIHRFITPYVYLLFLFWLPFGTGRVSILMWALALGLSLDFFTKTPGMHASAALWVAFLRPGLINILVPRETKELAFGSPGIGTMGLASYSFFVFILTFVHHSWLVMLEWLQLANFWYFLGKVFCSTLVSMVLYIIVEMLFRARRKRRID